MIAAESGQLAKKGGSTRSFYEPLDFAVLRAPRLPVEFYEAICQSAFDEISVRGFLDDEHVRFALGATSPVLLRALLSPATNPKDRARAIRKLRRYLIRMSTRPTPFGAFAGVAIAPLGARTTLQVHESQARHCGHVDVPWLLQFAHRLESNPAIFRQLKLQANPCAIERGGRVYIRELNPLSKSGNTVKNASLRATAMVKRTLDATRSPIAYETLSFRLAGSAGANEEKIWGFVTELWNQEFLTTELRPPFTNGDPVRYMLERVKCLRGAEPYRLELECRASSADSLSTPANSKPSNGESLDAHDDPRPTHISTVFPVSGELNVAVAREVARAAELLLTITPWPSGLPYLAGYRRSFEERYGTDREVPLLEMMDGEFGIGVPPAYLGKKTAPAEEQPLAVRLRREALFEIARMANDERRLEVELDEAILQRLRTWTANTTTAPVSLEVNAFVAAASPSEIDEGRFTVVVGPNVGAMEAGRSLGRFAEALGAVGEKAYRDAARACERVSSGRQCVELNYLPQNLQLTNILVRPLTREFEISVGTQSGVPISQTIPVTDLLVGVRGGRFYVRSTRFDRPLSICSGHMANIDFAPTICRLLTDLMLDGIAMLRDFDWGSASTHLFLPRVRVGRVVLSLAKWRISEATAKRHFRLENAVVFRTSLAEWRRVWNVPRRVHLTETDNRLVLDLENDMDTEDLRGELRRLSPDRPILLEEVYPSVEDAWLTGTSGRVVAEYVIPLVIHAGAAGNGVDASTYPRTRALRAIPSTHEPARARRVKPPGSDWLYIKLYVAPSLEDDLLTGPIRKLVHWARKSEVIQRWFFVRYADPEPHIRLRFQGDPATLSKSLLPKVLGWAQDLVKEDLCLRFAIDTYEREIERYGGDDAIDIAEELFSFDSESVLSLLSFLSPQCPLLRVEMAVIGLDFLFEKLGRDAGQRLRLFQGAAAPRHKSGPVYRERKLVLQALLGSNRDDCSRASSLEKTIGATFAAVQPNGASIADAGWRLRALDADGGLVPPLDEIYRSIAHMHCNRLGLDPTAEKLAFGLLTRTHETLQAFSRKRMPNAGAVCGV